MFCLSEIKKKHQVLDSLEIKSTSKHSCSLPILCIFFTWIPAQDPLLLSLWGFLGVCCFLPFSYCFFFFKKNFLLKNSWFGKPGYSDGKESACNAGVLGSICRLGKSPAEGNDCPLQHCWLENSMDRGA